MPAVLGASSRPRGLDRRSGPHPYRQGQLDTLCGLYAIINGVRALCPEIDGDTAWWLFDELVHGLVPAGSSPATALVGGISRRVFEGVARHAVTTLNADAEFELEFQRLRLKGDGPVSLDTIWLTLADHVSEGSVVLLGLRGQHEHWTVVHRVTDRRLILLDSDGLKHLNRDRCTVARTTGRHQLMASRIFILTRGRGGIK